MTRRRADIVLAEGFKAAPEPTVEVFRAGPGLEPLFDPDEARSSATLALVTDRPGLELPIPVFDMNGPDFVARLADFLQHSFLRSEGKP